MADYKQVKLMIKSVLGSSKHQMTQQELCKEYRSLIGSPLPYKQFGFNDSDSFLKSLTDTCIVTGSGSHATITPILSSDSDHIVKLIANQRENSRHIGFKVQNRPIIIPRQQNSSGMPSQYQQINPWSRPLLPFPIIHGIVLSPTKLHHPPIRFHHKVQSTASSSIQVEAQKSIASTSRVPRRQPEYNSNNASNIDDKSSNLSGLEAAMNYKVPFKIQNNLEALIKKFPEGLWIHDLPKEYFKEYNVKIAFLDYGYKSLVQMCGSLETIFKCKHVGIDRGKLYHVKADIPDDAPELLFPAPVKVSCADEALSVKALPDNIDLDYDDEYPPFVMRFGDIITKTTIPACDATLYVPIEVGEVYDLSKFWFRSVKHDASLNQLHKEMATYYDENYKTYQISEKLLVQGLYVVIYRGASVYNRGVVASFQEATARVFCIDDGEVLETSLINIFFMHKQFSDLPKQAMRGRLARLIPLHKQAQWTRDASYRFLELVNNKTLQGSVDCIDESQIDVIYDLVLCDTTHDHDIFIHDVLIREKHAIPIDQVNNITNSCSSSTEVETQKKRFTRRYLIEKMMKMPIKPLNITSDLPRDPTPREIITRIIRAEKESSEVVQLELIDDIYGNFQPIIQNLHLYPLFIEIEMGIVPKAIEMRHLVGMNISLPEIYPIYFKPKFVVVESSSNSSRENTNCASHGDKTRAFDITSKFESLLGSQERLDREANLCATPVQQMSTQPMKYKPDTYGIPPGLKPTIPVPPNTHTTPLPHHQERPGCYDVLSSEVDYLTRQNDTLSQQQLQLCFEQNTFQPKMNTFGLQFSEPSSYSDFLLRTQNIPGISSFETSSPINHNMSISQDLNRVFKGCDMISKPSTSSGLFEDNTTYNIRPKKYIYTEKIFDKYIHIVGFMQMPCVIISEIQKRFTGRDDPVLLRRLLAMTDIKLSDVCVDMISPMFLRQLEEDDLIGNSIRITYTNLGNLEELISCITNSKCLIQDFKLIFDYYSRRSLWDI